MKPSHLCCSIALGLVLPGVTTAQRDGCNDLAASGSAIVLTAPDEPGERLRVGGRIVDREGHPLAGVEVRVFHTDAAGYYSRGGMDESKSRLCGVFRSAEDGSYEIETIVPGRYATGGPAPHVHFEVRGGQREFKTLTWEIAAGDSAASKRTTSPRPMVKATDGDWRIEYDLAIER